MKSYIIHNYLQVYSYVMTIIKNQSLAEEITQNTFFKAMTTKKQFKEKSSELTWLCSIAKRLAIDECQKNSKFTELDETISESSTDITMEVEDKIWHFKFTLFFMDCKNPIKKFSSYESLESYLFLRSD